MQVELEKTEIDFIVDNALNGLWQHCREILMTNIGDIERKNIEECRDEAKRLMKKLDKSVF